MVGRQLLLIVLVTLGLSLAAADKPLQLSSDSDGKSIAVKVGVRFDLTLIENPSTGYAWEVTEGLGGTVKQSGKAEHHSLNIGTVGGGGTVTFHFQAATAGATHLKLVYHRSFEKDKPPLKTFQLAVKVSPS